MRRGVQSKYAPDMLAESFLSAGMMARSVMRRDIKVRRTIVRGLYSALLVESETHACRAVCAAGEEEEPRDDRVLGLDLISCLRARV